MAESDRKRWDARYGGSARSAGPSDGARSVGVRSEGGRSADEGSGAARSDGGGFDGPGSDGAGSDGAGSDGAGGADLAQPPHAVCGREHVVPTSGRALDVACGRGAVAVWLAERGLAVDAVDVSGSGLAVGAALAQRRGVADAVRWWRHDLDDGLPAGCDGPYDVVVCQRFRDPALYPVLAACLAPGGLLVVTVLSEVDGARGRWRAPAGELTLAFAGLEQLSHQEGDGEASLVARPLTPLPRGRLLPARNRRGDRRGDRTEATSPMLPTSVRTTSVATSWVVTTSPSAGRTA